MRGWCLCRVAWVCSFMVGIVVSFLSFSLYSRQARVVSLFSQRNFGVYVWWDG